MDNFIVNYNYNLKKRGIKNKENYIVGVARIFNSSDLKEILKVKGYSPQNDLEIILSLWNLAGTNGLKLIEGYFAFAILDKEKIIAARDAYGVASAYIGGNKNEFVISSRIKPIIKIKPSWIEWLSPGSIVRISKKGRNEKKFYELPLEPNNYKANKILEYITESLKLEAQKLKEMGIKKVGIPFSGGVDSSALAILAKKYIYGKDIKILAVSSGVEGSEDLKWAEKIAVKYKIPHKIKLIKKDEILDLLTKAVKTLESYNSNLITNALGKYVTAHLAKSLGISIFICADSIDEQLWGYHMIPPYSKECKRYFSQFSTPEEAWRDIFLNCYKTEGKLLESMNTSAGIESWLPYLYQKLVEYNLNLASKYKVKQINGMTVVKWALRNDVKNILPEDVAFRPKMPQRLGTGLQKLTQEVIEENVSTNEFKKMQIDLKAQGYSIHDKLEALAFKIWSKEFDPNLKYGKILNKFNLYPMVGYW